MQIPTSYTWTLPSGLTGSSTSRSITIKSSTAKTYASGTITVTATNDCGTSATHSSASAVKIVNCPGYFAAGGEYATSKTGYLNIPDKTQFATLTSSTWGFAKTGKDLCWYKTDGPTVSWSDAKTGCAGKSTSYNDGTSGWRLPNIAELGAVQSVYSALAGKAESATGTQKLQSTQYNAITEQTSVYALHWYFDKAYTGFYPKTGAYYSHTRCVKTL